MDDKFIMAQEDWDKIIAYSKMSYDKWKTEIGGMCVALFNEENKIMVISDPVIGKQEVSSTLCTLDKEWLADYYVEMAIKYGTEVKFVWWHSHHTMGVSWSGTDTNTMQEFNQGNYSMSLVVNLAENHTFRISWWKPTSGYIDTKLKVLKPEFQVTKEMQGIFDELVTRPAKSITKINTNIYNNGWSNAGWKNQYKQPGNQGPGYVDAQLMDRTQTLQEKFCDIMEKLLDEAFTYQKKWPDFEEEWKEIIIDAGKHDIVIEEFPKSEFVELTVKGEFPDATDYFESPDPELFLTRGCTDGYGNPLQENLFRNR